jgi:hypothetical protein
MKSYVRKKKGLGVPFSSTRQHFAWKYDRNLLNICSRLSIWPNGHRESQNFDLSNEYLERAIRPAYLLPPNDFFYVRC